MWYILGVFILFLHLCLLEKWIINNKWLKFCNNSIWYSYLSMYLSTYIYTHILYIYIKLSLKKAGNPSICHMSQVLLLQGHVLTVFLAELFFPQMVAWPTSSSHSSLTCDLLRSLFKSYFKYPETLSLDTQSKIAPFTCSLHALSLLIAFCHVICCYFLCYCLSLSH